MLLPCLLPVETFVVLDPKTNREAPVSLLAFFAMISAVPLALSRATNVVALVTTASTLAAMNVPMALTGDHFKEFTATKYSQRKLVLPEKVGVDEITQY